MSVVGMIRERRKKRLILNFYVVFFGVFGGEKNMFILGWVNFVILFIYI